MEWAWNILDPHRKPSTGGVLIRGPHPGQDVKSGQAASSSLWPCDFILFIPDPLSHVLIWSPTACDTHATHVPPPQNTAHFSLAPRTLSTSLDPAQIVPSLEFCPHYSNQTLNFNFPSPLPRGQLAMSETSWLSQMERMLLASNGQRLLAGVLLTIIHCTGQPL